MDARGRIVVPFDADLHDSEPAPESEPDQLDVPGEPLDGQLRAQLAQLGAPAQLAGPGSQDW